MQLNHHPIHHPFISFASTTYYRDKSPALVLHHSTGLINDQFQRQATSSLKFGINSASDSDSGEETINNPLYIHKCIKATSLDESDIRLNPELLEQPDKKGRTPLLLAAHEDELKPFTLLLKHGADITKTDRLGQTVLHLTARAACEDKDMGQVLRFLLAPKQLSELGININARDNQGHTPLDAVEARRNDGSWIEERDIDRVIALLRNKGGLPARELPAFHDAPFLSPRPL